MGSNYTFVAKVQSGDDSSLVIYKPRDGESPLWDFPSGTLYKREYAAYLLSSILGWDFIPFTTIRDGPYGIGTVQKFVEHVIKLDPWKAGKRYERLGLDESGYDILGVTLPYVEMPVGPGRNLSVLIEVAARNHLLKLKGFHPARELARKLGESLHAGDDEFEGPSPEFRGTEPGDGEQP